VSPYSARSCFQAWRARRRAGLGDSNDRTIRRTLTVMAEAGWLEHEPKQQGWHPGPKADERLTLRDAAPRYYIIVTNTNP